MTTTPTRPDGSAGEAWKAIPGYGGYECSDLGRVRRGEFILAQMPHPRGYVRVGLRGGWQLVHRLVLLTFIGPCPKGHECRHVDGDRTNNALRNLAWGTRVENAQDRFAHGTGGRGSTNSHARLREAQVVDIIRRLRAGEPAKTVAADYSVHPKTIRDIRNGRRWAWITKGVA